jgi:hypothetical protein
MYRRIHITYAFRRSDPEVGQLPDRPEDVSVLQKVCGEECFRFHPGNSRILSPADAGSFRWHVPTPAEAGVYFLEPPTAAELARVAGFRE